jgi:hypothetical protein
VVGVAEAARFTPPPITISEGIQVQPAAPMTARTGLRQTLRSSFLFVRLPAEQAWVGFRDVLEVNGRRVASDARGRAPIEKPGESSLDRWRRLSEESARYNIGSITRTLNVPTFALLVLHPDNPERCSFSSATCQPRARSGSMRPREGGAIRVERRELRCGRGAQGHGSLPLRQASANGGSRARCAKVGRTIRRAAQLRRARFELPAAPRSRPPFAPAHPERA